MPIHLITFASPRFRPRQLLLGWSALANGVVDTVTHWTPKMLKAGGYEIKCPKIKLNERGSGFYSWKPFIIERKLQETTEGDIVFYCDVGRLFPYKLLSGSLHVFLDWMQDKQQSVMPGIQIPWHGPMSMWTKRDAFVAVSVDEAFFHMSTPIQASFSIWINNRESKDIASEWMTLAGNRQMISDDPSQSGLPELPDFHEHRHDQSLLSLVCLKRGFKGIDLGVDEPIFDPKHPTEVAKILSDKRSAATFNGKLVAGLAGLIERIEWFVRIWIKFNKPSVQPKKISATNFLI